MKASLEILRLPAYLGLLENPLPATDGHHGGCFREHELGLQGPGAPR